MTYPTINLDHFQTGDGYVLTISIADGFTIDVSMTRQRALYLVKEIKDFEELYAEPSDCVDKTESK